MLDVIALSCTRQISRLFVSAPKKVIVLDCDNTLWGGSVADLGPNGVELSERFLSLQRFVLDQQQRGMILCLCSKNIPADVEAVFTQRSSEMVLRKSDHVVLSKVNWRPKSQNIQELAQELSLGLGAFIFIDDNAIECHEVHRALPEVNVIQLPEDFDSHFLKWQWVFDHRLGSKTTGEDGERTRLYQQNAMRMEQQRAAPTQAAFLSSLGIRIQCERVQDASTSSFDRILQLHQRTNTFNVATTFSRSVTRESLSKYVETNFALASTVTDRYGHYGLVCVSLFRIMGGYMIVDSFLMSCRSLNRGVEHAMVKRIAEIANDKGLSCIYVSWEPTVRNEPARAFFAALSTSEFVASVDGTDSVVAREEKLNTSASTRGFWKIKTSEALDISFLKEHTETTQVPYSSAWPSRFVAFLAGLLAKVIKVFISWPRIFRLLSWFYCRRNTLNCERDQKLPGVNVYHRISLAKLLASCLPGRPNHIETTERDLGEEHESDEAFRLRARHQTKVQLLDHVSADVPRVVWAPHRDDDIRLDMSEVTIDPSPSSVELQQFNRPCATPSCLKTVFWESNCTFQRCRTCCYRMQRLLARATSEDVNPRARAYSTQSLAEDFNFHIERTSRSGNWCSAHTNDKKRRGTDPNSAAINSSQ